MRFITEENLRALYRKEAFTDYCIPDGMRLTPGGRQYLVDKKIKIISKAYSSIEGKQVEKQVETSDCGLNEKKKKLEAIQIEELKAKMDFVESIFFITEQELLDEYILTAQKVVELRKQFAVIKNCLKTRQIEGNFCFEECSGMSKQQIEQVILYEDCFPIEEFHVQLKNGKQIVQLHKLRCAVKEVYIAILRLELESSVDLPYKKMKERMNGLIHAISQMLCMAVDGTKCQRKGFESVREERVSE